MQTSSLAHEQSFHPVFKTRVSAEGFENCSLHLLYTLPPLVFVDPYELANRADAYSFKYAGPSNLELPVAALANEDAALLLSIAWTPSDSPLVVEVPLHVRYGPAAAAADPIQRTPIPWPDAFFACPVSRTADALPAMTREFAAPFDNSSIFRVATPVDAARIETIQTPVGNVADVGRVELGTAVVVLASFFYLVRAVRRTVARMNVGLSNTKEE
ncbi:PIG-X [Mycena galericulata]|nr:PIG-X [Mycena galericulata]